MKYAFSNIIISRVLQIHLYVFFCKSETMIKEEKVR